MTVELNLTMLDYRRKRFNIIQVFKIIRNIDDIDMNIFFTYTDNGHLNGPGFSLGILKHASGIPAWHNLASQNEKYAYRYHQNMTSHHGRNLPQEVTVMIINTGQMCTGMCDEKCPDWKKKCRRYGLLQKKMVNIQRIKR